MEYHSYSLLNKLAYYTLIAVCVAVILSFSISYYFVSRSKVAKQADTLQIQMDTIHKHN